MGLVSGAGGTRTYHVHNHTQELLKIVATPSKKTRSEEHASSGSDSSDSDDEVNSNHFSSLYSTKLNTLL